MRKCGLRGLDRGCRRPRRRLPDFHVNDVCALRLAQGRSRHDIHDNKRRNIAAFGGLQELFCRLKHCFSPRPDQATRPAVAVFSGLLGWLFMTQS